MMLADTCSQANLKGSRLRMSIYSLEVHPSQEQLSLLFLAVSSVLSVERLFRLFDFLSMPSHGSNLPEKEKIS